MATPDSLWTAQEDAILKEHCRAGGTVADAAEKLAMSDMAVRGRAARLGLRFGPAKRVYTQPLNKRGIGHKAADERSAELLKAAGVTLDD